MRFLNKFFKQEAGQLDTHQALEANTANQNDAAAYLHDAAYEQACVHKNKKEALQKAALEDAINKLLKLPPRNTPAYKRAIAAWQEHDNQAAIAAHNAQSALIHRSHVYTVEPWQAVDSGQENEQAAHSFANQNLKAAKPQASLSITQESTADFTTATDEHAWSLDEDALAAADDVLASEQALETYHNGFNAHAKAQAHAQSKSEAQTQVEALNLAVAHNHSVAQNHADARAHSSTLANSYFDENQGFGEEGDLISALAGSNKTGAFCSQEDGYEANDEAVADFNSTTAPSQAINSFLNCSEPSAAAHSGFNASTSPSPALNGSLNSSETSATARSGLNASPAPSQAFNEALRGSQPSASAHSGFNTATAPSKASNGSLNHSEARATAYSALNASTAPYSATESDTQAIPLNADEVYADFSAALAEEIESEAAQALAQQASNAGNRDDFASVDAPNAPHAANHATAYDEAAASLRNLGFKKILDDELSEQELNAELVGIDQSSALEGTDAQDAALDAYSNIMPDLKLKGGFSSQNSKLSKLSSSIIKYSATLFPKFGFKAKDNYNTDDETIAFEARANGYSSEELKLIDEQNTAPAYDQGSSCSHPSHQGCAANGTATNDSHAQGAASNSTYTHNSYAQDADADADAEHNTRSISDLGFGPGASARNDNASTPSLKKLNGSLSLNKALSFAKNAMERLLDTSNETKTTYQEGGFVSQGSSCLNSANDLASGRVHKVSRARGPFNEGVQANKEEAQASYGSGYGNGYSSSNSPNGSNGSSSSHGYGYSSVNGSNGNGANVTNGYVGSDGIARNSLGISVEAQRRADEHGMGAIMAHSYRCDPVGNGQVVNPRLSSPYYDAQNRGPLMRKNASYVCTIYQQGDLVFTSIAHSQLIKEHIGPVLSILKACDASQQEQSLLVAPLISSAARYILMVPASYSTHDSFPGGLFAHSISVAVSSIESFATVMHDSMSNTDKLKLRRYNYQVLKKTLPNAQYIFESRQNMSNAHARMINSSLTDRKRGISLFFNYNSSRLRLGQNFVMVPECFCYDGSMMVSPDFKVLSVPDYALDVTSLNEKSSLEAEAKALNAKANALDVSALDANTLDVTEDAQITTVESENKNGSNTANAAASSETSDANASTSASSTSTANAKESASAKPSAANLAYVEGLNERLDRAMHGVSPFDVKTFDQLAPCEQQLALAHYALRSRTKKDDRLHFNFLDPMDHEHALHRKLQHHSLMQAISLASSDDLKKLKGLHLSGSNLNYAVDALNYLLSAPKSVLNIVFNKKVIMAEEFEQSPSAQNPAGLNEQDGSTSNGSSQANANGSSNAQANAQNQSVHGSSFHGHNATNAQGLNGPASNNPNNPSINAQQSGQYHGLIHGKYELDPRYDLNAPHNTGLNYGLGIGSNAPINNGVGAYGEFYQWLDNKLSTMEVNPINALLKDLTEAIYESMFNPLMAVIFDDLAVEQLKLVPPKQDEDAYYQSQVFDLLDDGGRDRASYAYAFKLAQHVIKSLSKDDGNNAGEATYSVKASQQSYAAKASHKQSYQAQAQHVGANYQPYRPVSESMTGRGSNPFCSNSEGNGAYYQSGANFHQSSCANSYQAHGADSYPPFTDDCAAYASDGDHFDYAHTDCSFDDALAAAIKLIDSPKDCVLVDGALYAVYQLSEQLCKGIRLLSKLGIISTKWLEDSVTFDAKARDGMPDSLEYLDVTGRVRATLKQFMPLYGMVGDDGDFERELAMADASLASQERVNDLLIKDIRKIDPRENTKAANYRLLELKKYQHLFFEELKENNCERYSPTQLYFLGQLILLIASLAHDMGKLLHDFTIRSNRGMPYDPRRGTLEQFIKNEQSPYVYLSPVPGRCNDHVDAGWSEGLYLLEKFNEDALALVRQVYDIDAAARDKNSLVSKITTIADIFCSCSTSNKNATLSDPILEGLAVELIRERFAAQEVMLKQQAILQVQIKQVECALDEPKQRLNDHYTALNMVNNRKRIVKKERDLAQSYELKILSNQELKRLAKKMNELEQKRLELYRAYYKSLGQYYALSVNTVSSDIFVAGHTVVLVADSRAYSTFELGSLCYHFGDISDTLLGFRKHTVLAIKDANVSQTHYCYYGYNWWAIRIGADLLLVQGSDLAIKESEFAHHISIERLPKVSPIMEKMQNALCQYIFFKKRYQPYQANEANKHRKQRNTANTMLNEQVTQTERARFKQAAQDERFFASLAKDQDLKFCFKPQSLAITPSRPDPQPQASNTDAKVQGFATSQQTAFMGNNADQASAYQGDQGAAKGFNGQGFDDAQGASYQNSAAVNSQGGAKEGMNIHANAQASAAYYNQAMTQGNGTNVCFGNGSFNAQGHGFNGAHGAQYQGCATVNGQGGAMEGLNRRTSHESAACAAPSLNQAAANELNDESMAAYYRSVQGEQFEAQEYQDRNIVIAHMAVKVLSLSDKPSLLIKANKARPHHEALAPDFNNDEDADLEDALMEARSSVLAMSSTSECDDLGANDENESGADDVEISSFELAGEVDDIKAPVTDFSKAQPTDKHGMKAGEVKASNNDADSIFEDCPDEEQDDDMDAMMKFFNGDDGKKGKEDKAARNVIEEADAAKAQEPSDDLEADEEGDYDSNDEVVADVAVEASNEDDDDASQEPYKNLEADEDVVEDLDDNLDDVAVEQADSDSVAENDAAEDSNEAGATREAAEESVDPDDDLAGNNDAHKLAANVKDDKEGTAEPMAQADADGADDKSLASANAQAKADTEEVNATADAPTKTNAKAKRSTSSSSKNTKGSAKSAKSSAKSKSKSSSTASKSNAKSQIKAQDNANADNIASAQASDEAQTSSKAKTSSKKSKASTAKATAPKGSKATKAAKVGNTSSCASSKSKEGSASSSASASASSSAYKSKASSSAKSAASSDLFSNDENLSPEEIELKRKYQLELARLRAKKEQDTMQAHNSELNIKVDDGASAAPQIYPEEHLEPWQVAVEAYAQAQKAKDETEAQVHAQAQACAPSQAQSCPEQGYSANCNPAAQGVNSATVPPYQACSDGYEGRGYEEGFRGHSMAQEGACNNADRMSDGAEHINNGDGQSGYSRCGEGVNASNVNDNQFQGGSQTGFNASFEGGFDGAEAALSEWQCPKDLIDYRKVKVYSISDEMLDKNLPKRNININNIFNNHKVKMMPHRILIKNGAHLDLNNITDWSQLEVCMYYESRGATFSNMVRRRTNLVAKTLKQAQGYRGAMAEDDED